MARSNRLSGLDSSFLHLERQADTVEKRRILQEGSFNGGEAKSLPFLLFHITHEGRTQTSRRRCPIEHRSRDLSRHFSKGLEGLTFMSQVPNVGLNHTGACAHRIKEETDINSIIIFKWQ